MDDIGILLLPLQKENKTYMTMKKMILVTLLFPLLFSTEALAQSDSVHITTKYEQFINNGYFTKLIDTKPTITELKFGGKYIRSFIRKVITDSGIKYYLVLTKKMNGFEYHPRDIEVAIIDYSDLKDINKAVKRLVDEEPKDRNLQPYYLENIFKTIDGFIIGYTVKKKKVSWLIRLNYSNYSYIDNIEYKEKLFDIFTKAQRDIEEIMAKDN